MVGEVTTYETKNKSNTGRTAKKPTNKSGTTKSRSNLNYRKKKNLRKHEVMQQQIKWNCTRVPQKGTSFRVDYDTPTIERKSFETETSVFNDASTAKS